MGCSAEQRAACEQSAQREDVGVEKRVAHPHAVTRHREQVTHRLFYRGVEVYSRHEHIMGGHRQGAVERYLSSKRLEAAAADRSSDPHPAILRDTEPRYNSADEHRMPRADDVCAGKFAKKEAGGATGDIEARMMCS